MIFLAFVMALAAATAGPAADIEIKAARLDYARAADTFGLSAVVTNNGPHEAPGTVALVYLPAGARVRNAEPCSEISSPREARLVFRCELGTLEPGDQRRVFFLVVTSEGRPHVTVRAVSDCPDSNQSNNMKKATTP